LARFSHPPILVRNRFLEHKLLNNIKVLDAAMGRALRAEGVEVPDTIWSAHALLVAPETVQAIHESNIVAGADVITTNTYGVIRSDLRKAGLEDRFEALNVQAAALARAAVDTCGRTVRIAGSLPPLFGSYRPDLVGDEAVMEPLYAEQAEVLAPHVDLFICETMSHIAEARAAASAASRTGKPVIVAFTLHDQLPATLRSKHPLAEALAQIEPLNLHGHAVNCCLPERVSDAMPILKAAGAEVVGAYANAFTHVPEDWLLDGDKPTDGLLQLRDDLSPEIYARFAEQWIDQGANLVGGCCGTSASHTAAIAALARGRTVR